MTPIERKEHSIAILKEQKIPYIDWLPVIEEEITIAARSAEEIMKRACCCLIAIQVACDYNQQADMQESKAFFSGFLLKFDLQEELTPKERVLFEGEPTEQEAINLAWKYEAIWPLFWACGFVQQLTYPDTLCDVPLLIDILKRNNSFDEIINQVKLRTIDELLNEADLIFRYDWACVDARLKNQEAPGNLNSGVVYERHCGLNWLIGKNTSNDDWDTVSADT